MNLNELKETLEGILLQTQRELERCHDPDRYLKLLAQLNSLTSRLLMIERLLSRKERERKKGISQVNVAWVHDSRSSLTRCCRCEASESEEESTLRRNDNE